MGSSAGLTKTYAEIAAAVLIALRWLAPLQQEKIKVRVEHGTVRLEGEVEWEYQRTSAVSAVQNLAGVRSVINLVVIKPNVTTAGVREKINASFSRHVTIDAAKISIEVEGSHVMLRGEVRTLAEKEDAEQAAWNAPGVTAVTNKITVETPEYEFEDYYS